MLKMSEMGLSSPASSARSSHSKRVSAPESGGGEDEDLDLMIASLNAQVSRRRMNPPIDREQVSSLLHNSKPVLRRSEHGGKIISQEINPNLVSGQDLDQDIDPAMSRKAALVEKQRLLVERARHAVQKNPDALVGTLISLEVEEARRGQLEEITAESRDLKQRAEDAEAEMANMKSLIITANVETRNTMLRSEAREAIYHDSP